MCEREGATCCVSWGAPCGAGGVWAGGSGDGKLSRAEPGSPGDAPAHCSALLPARVANLATAGEALARRAAAAQQPNVMREAQKGAGAAAEIFLDFDIVALDLTKALEQKGSLLWRFARHE